ncbi:MAG: hypothetical protein ACFFC7_31720 [Candidatus Hermodarchaeota archaeon]
MNNLEPERGDKLFKSQQTVLEKIQRNNQLFWLHFAALVLFLISSVMLTTLLVFFLYTFLLTGQLFSGDNLLLIVETLLLTVLNILLGLQVLLYGLFVIKANRYLRNIEPANLEFTKGSSILYYGIVSYINNVYSFFSRDSNQESKLSQLVSNYYFSNFYRYHRISTLIAFITLILLPNVAGLGATSYFWVPLLTILFFTMVGSWILTWITSVKIETHIQKWEAIFAKLEAWAQHLEGASSDQSIF